MSDTVCQAHERLVENMRSTRRDMPLFQLFAHCLEAMANMADRDSVWYQRHADVLAYLVTLLPRGSGFDVHPELVRSQETWDDTLTFTGSYHAIDGETGSYDRWVDYTVVVRASFLHGFSIEDDMGMVDEDLAEHGSYIAETFAAHLRQAYDLNHFVLKVMGEDGKRYGAC